MGMKAKEASGDQLLDWDHSGAAAPQTLPPTETSKPPFTRRQSPPPPSQQQEQSESTLKCPRCDSDNTKFCYYNNYNKSQPRHFCKSCKRHWTHGGTLRNVPMGGGRKNKRPRTTTTTPKSTATTTMATFPLSLPNTNIGSDNESMSRILYHTLIQSTTSVNPHKRNNDMITPDYKPPQNSNAIEESSTLSNHASFLQPPQNSNALEEGSTLSNHASYLHPINDVFIDQYPDDITTWPSLNMINSDMDLSNCWNWSEIDEHAFANSSDLNVAWDDVYWEAKP